MSPERTAVNGVLAATLITLITGCAVLRVDVDVYKGPLANHEDVQVQELAVMAVGANQLLLQLKSELKVGVASDSDNNKLQQYLNLVTTVLSLYEDQEAEFEELARRIERLTKQYARDFGVVEPFLSNAECLDQMKARWNELIQHMYPKLLSEDAIQEIAGHPFEAAITVDANRAAAYALLTEMLKSYEKYFTNDDLIDKADRDILQAHQQIEPHLDVNTEELKDLASTVFDKTLDADLDESGANARFSLLANEEVVTTHATMLFLGTDAAKEKREEFIEFVTARGRAFLRARLALALLLEDMLEILIESYARLQDTPGTSALIEDAATIIVDLLEPAHVLGVLQAAATDNAAIAIQMPLELRDYARDFKDARFLPEAFDESSRFWSAVDSSDSRASATLRKWYQLGEIDHQRFSEVMLSRLNDRAIAVPHGAKRGWGARTAQFLLAAHEWFKFQEDTNPSTLARNLRLPKRYDHVITRKYGLCVGPTLKIDKRDSADLRSLEFQNFMETVARTQGLASRVGLQGGRLPSGLFSMIDLFLQQSFQNVGVSGDAAAKSRYQLVDALIRFAEKLRIVASFNVLIDSEERMNQVTTVQVLQAIANTILVHADELRRKEAHDKKLREDARREAQALLASLGQSPKEVLDELMWELSERRDEADDKIDELRTSIAVLEKETGAGGTTVEDTEFEVLEDARAAARAAKRRINAANIVLNDTTMISAKIEDLIAADTQGDDIVATICKAVDALKAETVEAITIGDVESYFKDDAFINAPEFDKSNTAVGLESAREVMKSNLDKADRAFSLANDRVDLKRQLDRRNEFSTTMTLVVKVRDDVVKEAAGRRGDTVVGLLRNAVQASNAAETDLETAARVLGGFQPSGRDFTDRRLLDRIADAGNNFKGEDAKNVLDRLIAALRYERIRVIDQFGPNSARAKNIDAALQAAYEQRAGMIYIRPPAAYIRTSYPATSLQADPGIQWDNMLGKHALRSVPFAPQIRDMFDKNGEKAAEAVTEIDKQFWQNINSVRVAGGGNTNYALVKDDIGNWYVKGYSADPKPIIKAAQSLAMFNFGSQLGMDLNSVRPHAATEAEAPSGAPTVPGATNDPAEAGKGSLERTFDLYVQNYDNRTTQDRLQLAAELKDDVLSERLARAFQARVDSSEGLDDDAKSGYQEALSAARTGLRTAGETLGGRSLTTNQGSRIIAALHAVRRFHTDLSRELREAELSSAFQDDATRIIREFILSHLDRRRDAVEEYETAITFIGETAGMN